MKSQRLAARFFALLGFLFLFTAHTLLLQDVGGLHFDEAWSANRALHYAKTLRGLETTLEHKEALQSSYATPWPARIAGAAFALWGEADLLRFRAVHVSLVLAGILLAAWALRLVFGLGPAQFLPWVLLGLPGFVIGARLAIDLTGVHIFALGLLLLGLAWRIIGYRAWDARIAILVAALLGVSTHILFLAPLLAAFFIYWYQANTVARGDQRLIQVICLALLPLIFSVITGLPNPSKGILLLLLDLSVFVLVSFAIRKEKIIALLLRFPWPRILPHPQAWGMRALQVCLGLLAAVAIFNTLIFAEGHYWARIVVGEIQSFRFFGITIILLTVLTIRGLRKEPLGPEERSLTGFVLLTAIFILLMITKQAPRYYAMAILLLAIWWAVILSLRIPQAHRFAASLLLVVVGVGGLAINYWAPSVSDRVREREVSLFWFRDSSRDFLAKQKIFAHWLASGCAAQDLRGGDTRVEEALAFLRGAHAGFTQEPNAAKALAKPGAEATCPFRSATVFRAQDQERTRATPFSELSLFGFSLIGERSGPEPVPAQGR